MRVFGSVGSWYVVEYTVKGSFDMRSHKVHSVDDSNLEHKLKLSCAIKSGCAKESVEIYNVFRVVE